jgi:hypothetical protein
MMHEFICLYLVFICKKTCLMNKSHNPKGSFNILNDMCHGNSILGFTPLGVYIYILDDEGAIANQEPLGVYIYWMHSLVATSRRLRST